MTRKGIPWAAGARLGAFVVAACFIHVLAPFPAFAGSIRPPAVSVPSATLMTMDGLPLWSRNPSAHRRVASTIKMLNALVVRDRASLDETVVVSRRAAAVDEGDVGLIRGQRLTVRQLLQIMLVASANDAAVALAIHVGGTEAKYVALMNAKAKALGLSDTHAADPNGLSKREISTARDLSVLARRVMADPVLRAIVSRRAVVVPRRNGKRSVVRSTNQLLGCYAGMQGTKTGFTRPAGYCFVGSAKRGGVELLGVVLGAKSNAGRFREMRRLLDWGFAHLRVRCLVSQGATMGVVTVEGGVGASVAVCATGTTSATLFDGDGPVTTRVVLPPSVMAPVTLGQPLGTVEVYQGSSMIASAPLAAASAVPQRAGTATLSAVPPGLLVSVGCLGQ